MSHFVTCIYIYWKLKFCHISFPLKKINLVNQIFKVYCVTGLVKTRFGNRHNFVKLCNAHILLLYRGAKLCHCGTKVNCLCTCSWRILIWNIYLTPFDRVRVSVSLHASFSVKHTPPINQNPSSPLSVSKYPSKTVICVILSQIEYLLTYLKLRSTYMYLHTKNKIQKIYWHVTI